MLPDDHPDRIQIAFDDHRLVNNAGLILPATLALHLGLPELVDRRLDLGDAPGRANTGAKIMTLVASALAGGDCIDDVDVLRTGGTAGALGCVVNAVAASQTLPPRKRGADATRVSILSPAFARPGASARSTWLSTSSRRPKCWARVTGRSSPALATRRWSSKAI